MEDYSRTRHKLGEKMAPVGNAQGTGAGSVRTAIRPPTPKKRSVKHKLDTSPNQKKHKRLQKRNRQATSHYVCSPTPPPTHPASHGVNIREGGSRGLVLLKGAFG